MQYADVYEAIRSVDNMTLSQVKRRLVNELRALKYVIKRKEYCACV